MVRVPSDVLIPLGICPEPGAERSSGRINVWCAWDPEDGNRAAQARAALRPYFPDGAVFVFVRGLGDTGFDENQWIKEMIGAREQLAGGDTDHSDARCSICGERRSDSRRLFRGKSATICSTCAETARIGDISGPCNCCERSSPRGIASSNSVICEACIDLARTIVSGERGEP